MGLLIRNNLNAKSKFNSKLIRFGNIEYVYTAHKSDKIKFDLHHGFKEYLMNHYLIEFYPLMNKHDFRIADPNDFNTAFRFSVIDQIMGHKNGMHGILQTSPETNRDTYESRVYYALLENKSYREVLDIVDKFKRKDVRFI